MCTHEMQNDRVTVVLYFYAAKTCFCAKKILYAEEEVQIEIPAEQLLIAFPIRILVKRKDDKLTVGDTSLFDGGYLILKTKAGEEILLIVKAEKIISLQCGKILFPKERILTVGTNFQNAIFYEYFSFLKEQAIVLYWKDDNCILESSLESNGQRAEGLYVNGRATEGTVLLEKGDRVELFGLRILVLPYMLICTAAYGTLRIAERREENQIAKAEICNRKQDYYRIQQGIRKEEKLCEDIIELEQPEVIRKQAEQPLLLTIGPAFTMMIPSLLMMVIGNVLQGQAGDSFYGMTAVMTISCAMLTLLWSLINRSYRRRAERDEKAGKEREYLIYLKKADEDLKKWNEKNKKILLEKYCMVNQIIGKTEGVVFWNTGRGKERFIRLGLGNIPSPLKVEVAGNPRVFPHSELCKEAYKTAERYQQLADVPVGIFLKEEESTGFVGENVATAFLQMLVQTVAYYGRGELKLIYFFHEDVQQEKEIAECLKWLPQIWREDKKKRFLAGNEREAGEILPYLTKELRKRMESRGEKEDTYLFLIANPQLIKDEQLYSLLTKGTKAGGYHVVFIGKRREQIPGSVSQLIVREKGREEILIHKEGVWERQEVILEECRLINAEKYMRSLVNKWENDIAESSGLPDKVSFLDLYDCHMVEELYCLRKWNEKDVSERMRVPIGIGSGGRILYLDVHEKFHGPHGLIAGTTGSGKSELLQTYLLSLSVCFSPEAINFFIIDYKGGGMGRELCELPHCAGVISNLSGHQIKRALLSIKSENTRRQMLLSTAGVSHVDEYTVLYREGKVEEAMPHLILVVDEFAELKKEEPAFMQEIISMAQIGRSLGVHLILATQKPAGTIDDKIWSNTRFRLCLRVADRQDSMDMLRRPEAADLTGVGRCYMQIGNNEIFELLQTGYSKETYESRRISEKTIFVSTSGKQYKRKMQKKCGQANQLKTVIHYIGQSFQRAGYKKAKNLWMQELPQTLCLEAGIKRSQRELKLYLGKYDDPYRQQQNPLFYDPIEEGHLCLFGMPSTGKSTFLQTLLWQICTQYDPSCIQFLLAGAFDAGIRCFIQMPHCMGYLQNAREAECFFYHLEHLIQKRKELLGGISFAKAQKRQEQGLIPMLFVIDSYGMFREMTQDKYQKMIEQLSREGLQYGIYLIITALGLGSGEMPGKLFEKMKRILTLAMSDKVQYGDILRQYQIPVELAENVKGRGLCKVDGRVLEFQVPLLADFDDYGRIKQVEHLAKELQKEQKIENRKAYPAAFIRIPDEPLYETMIDIWKKDRKETGQLPLGYRMKSGYLQFISLKEHFPFLISGEEKTGKRNTMYCLIETLVLNKTAIAVFDRNPSSYQTAGVNKRTVLLDEKCFWEWFCCLKKGKVQEPVCLVIADLADFVQMLLGREYLTTELVRELEEMVRQKELLVLACILANQEAELLGNFWYELFLKKQCGIHLGGNVSGQRVFSFDDLGYAQLGKREKTGIGYLKLGYASQTCRILIPKLGKDEENDISGCTGACT